VPQTHDENTISHVILSKGERMVRIFFDEFDERRTAQDLFDGPFDVRQI
jgi:hypothetical protein